MNDTLTQLLKKGLRVTIGATATLVETLQDPQRRDANLSRLTNELSSLAEEWESKGIVTEQEARNFVNSLWNQQSWNQQSSSTTSDPETTTAPPTSPAAADVQQDLQELTAQIAAMRAEIERLRAQDGP